MNYIFTIIFSLGAIFSNAQDGLDNAFAKANKAYTAEKYEIAIAGYNQILKANVHSTEVYFNLANAHYKLNHIAPAIYNYEKALQLDPNNQDVLTNLRYANQMKLDAVEALPKDGFKEWFKSVVSSYSIDTWAYFSIVAGLLTILLLILYVYAQVAGKKRLFFILSMLGILVTLFFIYAAFAAVNLKETERYAIIFDSEVITRIEPRSTAETALTLHEGTKVAIIETLDDWAHVQIANGSKSWIPLDAIKEL